GFPPVARGRRSRALRDTQTASTAAGSTLRRGKPGCCCSTSLRHLAAIAAAGSWPHRADRPSADRKRRLGDCAPRVLSLRSSKPTTRPAVRPVLPARRGRRVSKSRRRPIANARPTFGLGRLLRGALAPTPRGTTNLESVRPPLATRPARECNRTDVG